MRKHGNWVGLRKTCPHQILKATGPPDLYFSCFQVVDGSKTKGCKAQSGFGKLCAVSLDDFNAKAGAACPGDSGSPLVTYHEQNGGWTLIGLLSNGAKSCFKGLPEVYTKVGDYLDWIHTTINENSLQNIQVYP